MKYLVIWFVLQSMIGAYDGFIEAKYHTPMEVKEGKNKTTITYQNYQIVDTFEEAKKIAAEKKSRDTNVYIYELGKQYEVERKSYKVKELREITKYENLIKEIK